MAAFELKPQTISRSSSVLGISELSAKKRFKNLARPSQIHLQNPSLRQFSAPPLFFSQYLKAHSQTSLSVQRLRIYSVKNHGDRFAAGCTGSSEVVGDGVEFEAGNEEKENVGSVSSLEEEVVGSGKQEFGVNQSIWEQMKEIMMFTGPAAGLWICGPLMSLIDTAVIGQGSSVELAALGPATVILGLAAPVFVTMMSKVAFYSFLIYFATSMGTHTIAAHQVLSQLYSMCAVWGEPLSQTAQSFMPELIYGANQSLAKARTLLISLLIMGALIGLTLGTIAITILWLFPNTFTHDGEVIQEMHKVLIPYFLALVVTPSTHSLEGTLLFVNSREYGLPGCWLGLVAFQWARFFLALQRLLSPNGILYSEDLNQSELGKMKAV